MIGQGVDPYTFEQKWFAQPCCSLDVCADPFVRKGCIRLQRNLTHLKNRGERIASIVYCICINDTVQDR